MALRTSSSTGSTTSTAISTRPSNAGRVEVRGELDVVAHGDRTSRQAVRVDGGTGRRRRLAVTRATVPAASPPGGRGVPSRCQAAVAFRAVSEPQRFDVVGIGNALVDVIAHAGDSFLAEHALVKGSMELVDTDRAVYLYRALGSAVEMSGGSAANTMCGVASFGGRAAYIGKVSDDELGAVFGHDLNAVGVAFRPGAPHADTPTGRCIIVVTPDAQRTMNTYLGVSSLLSADDLDEDTIAAGAVLYMEGYLFDRDDAKKAFRRAAGVAHANGRKVSLTLSDSFCVDRHRTDFAALVRDDVDILFGNADELCSLYESESLDEAIAAVRAGVRAGGDHPRQGRLVRRDAPTT